MVHSLFTRCTALASLERPIRNAFSRNLVDCNRQIEVSWYDISILVSMPIFIALVDMSPFSEIITLVLSCKTLILGALLPVVADWLFSRVLFPQPKIPYPPGPPEKSRVSGNLNDLPTTFAWRTYIELGEIYGNISKNYHLI